MLTLEEAIKHCEEVAEENESKANRIEQLHLSGNAEGCRECASDHRQLAEWLQELKIYREHTYAEMMQDEEVNADGDSD